MTVRNFEPDTRWVDDKGMLTERAKGFLRSLFDYIGAGTGTLPVSSLPDHNDLTGLQGGTTGQYHHLTTAQQSALHDAVTVADTTTVNMTVAGQLVTADAITQMSVTSDASGLKLSGDVASPGNTYLYGTNGSGVKGWYAQTIPIGANPSASIGLTATNGAASTFMRSDAAPAISQSITPTWSGVHEFEAGIVLAKTSGVGVKVDVDTPTFGWRDILGPIDVRGTGAADPTYSIYTGTALRAYEFSATVMKEVFIVFHVPHDYVPGTDIHFHAHWSNAAAAPNTGNVRWGFEYSFAKGFNQEAFPATSTVYALQACPATRYQHNIAETAAVTVSGMEVDGLILVRVFRDAADVADTCTDAVYLHTADIHYQSTNMATKNKAPGFYG